MSRLAVHHLDELCFHSHSKPWSMKVVREVVKDDSVAVLVEITVGQSSRQAWGSAPVGPCGAAVSLAQACADGQIRATELFLPTTQSSAHVQPYYSYPYYPAMPTAYSQVPSGFPAYHAPPFGAETSPQFFPNAPQTSAFPIDPSQQANPHGGTAPFGTAPLAQTAQHYPPVGPVGHASGADPPTQMIKAPSPAGVPSQAMTAPVASTEPVPSQAPASKPKPDPSPTPGASSGDLSALSELSHVLVIDDDSINVKMLKRSLVRGGLKVSEGQDGEDAIRTCIAEGKKYDLILMDENMRHINGTTAAIEIRINEKKLGHPRTPIIAATGNSAPHDVALYFGCGIDGILSKPIDMKKLVPELKRYYRHQCKNGPHYTRPELWDLKPKDDQAKLHSNDLFENSMLFGDLEIFGRIKPGMEGAAAAAAKAKTGHSPPWP